MFLLGRLLSYYRDVVDTVREVLVLDDPMLCDCEDDRWCTDCSLLLHDPTPLPWPSATSPLDAA
jgi:hypothetical protein